MGQYYSYINIKTNDENKIKNITDKYEICLPVCELCVRENELEDIVKEWQVRANIAYAFQLSDFYNYF